MTGDQLEVRARRADDPEVLRCLLAYYAELDERFDTGFDAEQTPQADVEATTPPNGIFYTLQWQGDPEDATALGIGALRPEAPGVAEIKRMWVAPEARGLGGGKLILNELEQAARRFGYREVWLDSNGTLVEAIALYRSMGYSDVPRYNTHPFAQVWLGKVL